MNYAWTAVIVALSQIMLASAQAQPLPTPRQARLSQEIKIDGHTEVLVQINGIAVATDGRIALIQQQDHSVKVFSSTGVALGTIGRGGRGPGDFTSIAALGWIADTLWVFDNLLRRFSFFTTDGHYRRGIQVPNSVNIADAPPATLTALALTSSESMLGSFRRSGRGTSEALTWAQVAADGKLQNVVSELQASPYRIEVTTPRPATVSMPYWANRYRERSSNGKYVAIVEASVEGPRAGTFGVVLVRAAGDTVYSRRYRFTPAPIRKSEADSVIRRRVMELKERQPVLAEEFRKRVRLPPSYPPIRSVHVGMDGTVWIGMRTVTNVVPYVIIDSRGDQVASARLSTRQIVADVTQNHVWTLEYDDFDVQSLIRYRVSFAAR